ncbi:MAG: hypothetical protein ACRYFS_08625 [Janthinobacterium lividum]
MNQHEVVHLALEQNGGFATLGQLYHVVTKMPEWESSSLTPFASIRRIVQQHPSLFFRIRPGLWGLEAQKEAIGNELALPHYAPPAKADAFSHSYYQGLLIEVGNLKNYQTAVPSQDKNQMFLKRKLLEVATLSQPYDFTYSDIMSKARTVDVSWFNARRFPQAFFEVEHSTDIYNSLLKYVEFQDFRTEFWIVADKVRKSEFEKRLKATAFVPIQDRVKFLDYGALSKLHSSLSESAAQEALLK